jgi:hypothetical protein
LGRRSLKTRDILILAGLVVLILGLTIAEKYADRRREERREAQAVTERAMWQERMNKALEERRQELSLQLRHALDSMASDVVAGGVPRESLAAVLLDSTFPGTESAATTVGAPSQSNKPFRPVGPDTLARSVLREYDKGLVALPSDLTAYERRVAVSEVTAMVRARFGLSQSRFDSLLKVADRRP